MNSTDGSRSGELDMFSPSDSVCFIGDSITHSALHIRYIQEYYKAVLHVDDLNLMNCGVAGNSAIDAIRRFESDIMVNRPNRAVIMFGMNDGNMGLYETENPDDRLLSDRSDRKEAYRRNMEELVQRLTEQGVNVCLLTPTPYDEFMNSAKPVKYGYNGTLEEYAGIVKALADKWGCQYVDLHGPMSAINEELHRLNPSLSLIKEDRIHPTEQGHLVMAYLLLQAQRVPLDVFECTPEQLVIQDRALRLRNVPATMVPAEFKRKLDEKNEREQIVRSYWFVTMLLQHNGVDPQDEQAVMGLVNTFMEENKTVPWWIDQLNNYVKVRADPKRYIGAQQL